MPLARHKTRTMKQKILLGLVLVLLSIPYAWADTVDVKMSCKVTKLANYSELKLSVVVVDTAQPVSNPMTFFKMDKLPQAMNFDQDYLKAQLMELLKMNKNLKILVPHKEYMQSIFDMIKSKKDRARAINLYDENNYANVIQINTNSNQSTVNSKKLASTMTIDILIPLVVGSSCTLVLEGLWLKFGTRMCKTQKVSVDFTK